MCSQLCRSAFGQIAFASPFDSSLRSFSVRLRRHSSHGVRHRGLAPQQLRRLELHLHPFRLLHPAPSSQIQSVNDAERAVVLQATKPNAMTAFGSHSRRSVNAQIDPKGPSRKAKPVRTRAHTCARANTHACSMPLPGDFCRTNTRAFTFLGISDMDASTHGCTHAHTRARAHTCMRTKTAHARTGARAHAHHAGIRHEYVWRHNTLTPPPTTLLVCTDCRAPWIK